MHVWLVTVAEPLPLPGQTTRLYRTGRLARALLRQGHRVSWWTSTFDHIAKARLTVRPGPYHVEPGLELRFLDGVSYRRNVSVRRWVNHWQLGRAFRQAAPLVERPDIILASFPTIELCAEAVRYATRRGVPALMDIRDLWPDVFWTALPGVPAWLARAATYPLTRAARRALAGCDGLVATSDGYLRWGLRQARRARAPLDEVIPLGYERPEFGPEDRGRPDVLPTLARGSPARIAWFVGSFGRSYDLAPVIAAARRMHEGGRHQIAFVLSGAGEREQAWKALAADLPNVHFTGWLDRSGIGDMMGRAWVGLAAYGGHAPQGLPNKLFEYLAAGLPIVSSLQGEARTFLERFDCGLTYDVGDGAGLAATLGRLAAEPALHRRLADNARKTFQEHFTADIVDQHLVALLERAAARRGRGDPVPSPDAAVG